MTKRPEGLIYGVNERPPWPTLGLLGLQYAGLLSIYLVLIVIVFKAGGATHEETLSAVSLGMIAIAVGTMLQALRKGPIGSGFLAAPVFSAIYLGPSVLAAKFAGLPAVFGMTILAGVMEVLLARYLDRLRIFFPPAISGFIVVIVGIQLGLVAVDHILDIEGFQNADYSRHVIVSVLTLFAIIGLSVWAGGMARLMCSMIGIVFGFGMAALFGIVPSAHWQLVANTPVFALPDPSFISYSVDPTFLPAFLIAGIAAALRTVGVVTTCQKINDDDWKRPDLKTIKGGMIADGLGCMVGGLCGVVGMNAGPSLVGVSKASGATSRSIAFVAGGFLILFALVPVIASLFLILPNAVVGAALLFTSCFMISGGFQIMVSRNVDSRMTYVIGISMLLGLSQEVFGNFFKLLPQAFHIVTSSMLSLSVVSALTLHLVFRIGSRRTASIVIEESSRSIEDVADLLQKMGRSWNVDPEAIARAVSTTKQVLEHIAHAHLVTGNLNAAVSYDDLNLVVTIDYRGTLLSLPHVGIHKRVFVEEEAFSYGLADFLTGVYPDRMESTAHRADSTIRLYFSA